MSIEAMNRVWKLSEQKGSELLLMLALADCANNKSFCWPGEDYLAERIRMSQRHTSRMLTKLEATGELYRIKDKGRGRKSFYVVAVGLSDHELESLLIEQFKVAPLEAKFAIGEWRQKGNLSVFVEIKDDNLSTTGDAELSVKGDILSDSSAENVPLKGDNLSGNFVELHDSSEILDTGVGDDDRQVRKYDILTQKDDTGVRPYKEHEPSWNHHEPTLESSVNRQDGRAGAREGPDEILVRNFWTLGDDDLGGFIRRDVVERYEQMTGRKASKADRDLVEVISGEFPFSSRAVIELMGKITSRGKRPIASFAYYRKSLAEIFKRCEKAARAAGRLAAGADEAKAREMIVRAVRREIKAWEERAA
ncbi:MAG: helix-turn-helix domain-containing protein [Blastocatellia bacterium]